MKMPRLLLLLLPLFMDPAGGGEIVGDVLLGNGDRISDLSEIEVEDGHFLLPAGDVLPEPIKVRLDRLIDICLDGGDLPAGKPTHVADLLISNGDTLSGQLAGVDPDHVMLKTWYGGVLRIKRSMCRSIEIERPGPVVYAGPDSLESWTISGDEDGWSLDNYRFLARGDASIAREFELPDKFRVSFNLEWTKLLKFRIFLCADRGAVNGPENCYEVVMQRRYVYLRKRWATGRAGGSQTIGRPANVSSFGRQQEAHLEFFVDRKVGRVALFVDGRPVGDWMDSENSVGKFGNWIHLVAEREPLDISRLRILPWVGDVPGGPGSIDDEKALRLEDGVGISAVEAAGNGELVVRTGNEETRLGIGHMLTIDLTAEDNRRYEEPIRRADDVRAWLRTGGGITLQLRSLKGGSLVGYSQAFGEVTLDIGAFSRIEFNIYDPYLDPLDARPER